LNGIESPALHPCRFGVVDAVRRGLGLPFAAPLPSPEGREGGAAVAGPQYGV